MRSDRGRGRERVRHAGSSRAGWLDGEEFANVCGLGRLDGIVDCERDALWDFWPVRGRP